MEGSTEAPPRTVPESDASTASAKPPSAPPLPPAKAEPVVQMHDEHDGEGEIKVARITKVILRWPCMCMWTMLVTIIILTIAVIGAETSNRAGFLDILCAPSRARAL